MKKIITLLFLITIGTTYAQVGVGTPLPDNSSQLDVVSNSKGVLIPRISLTNSTDATTITNGNVVSLLVYNTNTVVGDIAPGYHYWDGAKWQRIVSQEDIVNILNNDPDVLQDNGDGTFTHTAIDGTIVTFDANTTTLVDNGDGTYIFTNDNGDTITVDVIGDVVTNIQNQGDIYNELINVINANSDVLEDNGNGTFTHTAADGTIVTFDANTTTMNNNGDGTYTFTNANGDTITVDVIGDVVTNIQNQGDIYNELINVINANSDILQDNGDGTFTHTAADGTIVIFDANTTTMTNNGDGTYTFTNANGDTITVDVIGDVVTNIQNQGDIYNEIINVINANSDVLQDNGDGTFTHTAADGTIVTFDANTTTMTNNGDGTYTFTNANGDTITVDVIGDVVTNIQNQGDIYNEIINVINTNSDVLQDNGDGTFTHTAADNTVISFDITQTGTGDPNGNGTTGAAGSVYIDESTGDVWTFNGTLWINQNPITNEPWFGTDDNMGATDNTEDIYSLGNVGVGTASPGNDLHVAGGLRITLANNILPSNTYDITTTTSKLRFTYLPKGTFMELAGIGNQTHMALRIADANQQRIPNYSFLNDTNTGMSNINNAPDNLRFVTDGNERIRINELGNVGIGTMTPNERLEVNGKVRVNDLTGVDSDPLVNPDFIVAADDVTGELKAVSAASLAAVNEPWFGTDDNMGATENTEDIYTMGHVGIGISTPTPFSLHIQEGGNANIAIDSETGFESQIFFREQSVSKMKVAYAPSRDAIGIVDVGTNNLIMTAEASGNVGIGTATPNEKLEVNGKVRVSDLTGVDTDPLVNPDLIVTADDVTGELKAVSAASLASGNEPWFGAGPDTTLGTADDTGATDNTELMYHRGRVKITNGTNLNPNDLSLPGLPTGSSSALFNVHRDMNSDADYSILDNAVFISQLHNKPTNANPFSQSSTLSVFNRVEQSSAVNYNELRTQRLSTEHMGTGTVNELTSLEAQTVLNGTGTVSGELTGVNIVVGSGIGSTVNQMFAVKASLTAAGTSNDTYGFYYENGISTGAGIPTNGYGIYLEDIQGTNDYGIYQAGADDDNFFGGRIFADKLDGANLATDLVVTADFNTGELKSTTSSTIATTAAIRTETANYAVLADDATILIDATAGSVTVTLPTPVLGKKYVIKKIDATVNSMVLNGAGATIDGAATRTTTVPYQTFVLQNDGTNWFIIN